MNTGILQALSYETGNAVDLKNNCQELRQRVQGYELQLASATVHPSAVLKTEPIHARRAKRRRATSSKS